MAILAVIAGAILFLVLIAIFGWLLFAFVIGLAIVLVVLFIVVVAAVIVGVVVGLYRLLSHSLRRV